MRELIFSAGIIQPMPALKIFYAQSRFVACGLHGSAGHVVSAAGPLAVNYS